MTLIKPDGNDGAAREILRVAAEHFEQAILKLDTATDRLIGGEDSTEADAKRTALNLFGMSKAFMTEKQKIEKLNRTDAGIVYDFAIDFAKAREGIERRMARLRDVADAGDVSE